MRDAPWKSLVEQLKDPEAKSDYLARVESCFGAPSPGRNLERELVEEMAQALHRSHAKVDDALRKLRLADERIETASGRDERTHMVAEYNQRRQQAIQARWELMIHREALGFRRNREIERSYPIPPRRDP